MMTLLLVAATPIATATPDPESMLSNALSMGASLPGLLGAIFVGLVVVAWAIFKISKYFEEKGKREREAYDEDQRVRKLQADNTARMQNDAVQALMDNMDLSYRQDYDYCVLKIKDKKYSAVYAKFNLQFKEQIATFLYDESLTPEFRAGRVIQVVRKL